MRLVDGGDFIVFCILMLGMAIGVYKFWMGWLWLGIFYRQKKRLAGSQSKIFLVEKINL
jgi:hypothetical protein